MASADHGTAGAAGGDDGGAGDDTRCGFVAVLGAANAGKSTLVNRLVGSKVSIVSPKVQTTRTRILGIVLRDRAQLVLIDTPGVFLATRRLERAMMAAAWTGATDADQVLVVIDARRGIEADARRIIDGLRSRRRNAMVALNKVDLVRDKSRLLQLAAEIHGEGLFTDVLMISAMTGDGVDRLATILFERLPKGPWMFPADQISDMPMRLLAAEITREQLYLQLHQELPYACAVETESWAERADGSVRIDQAIYVERDSQKAIVLGKAGSRIKTIGEGARLEAERLFERRVHLLIHVKVRADWSDDPERYRDLGLPFDV
jgi:GTP-binding protein Era